MPHVLCVHGQRLFDESKSAWEAQKSYEDALPKERTVEQETELKRRTDIAGDASRRLEKHQGGCSECKPK